MIPRNIALVITVSALAIAGAITTWQMWPAGTPGRGKPAEIYDPATGARHATTWDQVFSAADKQPPETRFDPANGWMTVLPDKPGGWGWVVEPGQTNSTPIPALPG